MAGNTELDNAVLGGSADYIGDIVSAMSKAYFAKQALLCVFLTTFTTLKLKQIVASTRCTDYTKNYFAM